MIVIPTMSYKNRPRWLERIYKRNNQQWERLLERIDNPFLKIKVACVCWWDRGNEKNNYTNINQNYLYNLVKQYRPYFEDHYIENDLQIELMKIGYPKRKAIIRCQEPKSK